MSERLKRLRRGSMLATGILSINFLLPNWSLTDDMMFMKGKNANCQPPHMNGGLSIMDNPFRCGGAYTDVESGMSYCGKGYYSPELMTIINSSRPDVSSLTSTEMNSLIGGEAGLSGRSLKLPPGFYFGISVFSATAFWAAFLGGGVFLAESLSSNNPGGGSQAAIATLLLFTAGVAAYVVYKAGKKGIELENKLERKLTETHKPQIRVVPSPPHTPSVPQSAHPANPSQDNGVVQPQVDNPVVPPAAVDPRTPMGQMPQKYGYTPPSGQPNGSNPALTPAQFPVAGTPGWAGCSIVAPSPEYPSGSPAPGISPSPTRPIDACKTPSPPGGVVLENYRTGEQCVLPKGWRVVGAS